MGLSYRGEYGNPEMVELELDSLDARFGRTVIRSEFPIGAGCLWFTNTAPSADWILAQGQSLRQNEYPALYALWGLTYGGGTDSGAASFSAPDLRQRYPMGRAASGTGSTLASTFGTIDHTHAVNVAGTPSFVAAPGAWSDGAANPPTLVVNFAIRAR